MKLPGITGKTIHKATQKSLVVAWVGGIFTGLFFTVNPPAALFTAIASIYLAMAMLPPAERESEVWRI